MDKSDRLKAVVLTLIGTNKRCLIAGYQTAEIVRHKERSTLERVNARLNLEKSVGSWFLE